MLTTEAQSSSTDLLSLPFVELSFGVIGQTLPADHGYGLYGAIAHICSEIHAQERISIQTITGIPDHNGKIYISSASRLRIRLPINQSSLGYQLAGKYLRIGHHSIRLAIPQVFLLQPSSRLQSRLTIIKGFQEPEGFLEATRRQLNLLEIQGTATLPNNLRGEPDRKTIKIKRFTIVGFGLEICELNEEDSIKLQIYGLGGKHHMGCGIFTPIRGES